MPQPRVGTLDIRQDLPFQRRMWTAQRAGWVVMLVIAVAALAGLTGRGPLASATAGSAQAGVELEYTRVARHRADTRLVFTVQPSAVQDGRLMIAIDAGYLAGLHLVGILPEPERVAITPEWVRYTFQVEDAARPVEVAFTVEPLAIGLRTLVARVGVAELRARQLIYP